MTSSSSTAPLVASTYSLSSAPKSFSVSDGSFTGENTLEGNSDANTEKQPPTTTEHGRSKAAPEDRARGKRMMGVLMGTLSKFKSEENGKSEANLKRLLLEQKLAERLRLEKEKHFNQNEEQLNQSLNPAEAPNYPQEIEKILAQTQEICKDFRKTATEPCLFWRPAMDH